MPTTTSGFYRVFLGPFDYLIPKSSQAVTTVMTQPYLFHKPAAVRDGLVESLGVGLVAAEGSVHKVRGLDLNLKLSSSTLTFLIATKKTSYAYIWDES